ncbi:unnamed protein product, partial [Rotaria sp. Silwood1]
AIYQVQGGQPCQTCRFNEYINNSPLSNRKTFDKSSISTDKSQKQISNDFNPHHLLYEHENETIISNDNGQ